MPVNHQQVLDALPGSVFLAGAEGQILYANISFVETFGGLRTDITSSMSVGDLGQEPMKLFRRSLSGENEQSSITIDKPSLKGAFLLQTTPYLSDGTITGVVGILLQNPEQLLEEEVSAFCPEKKKFHVVEKSTWLTEKECETFFYLLQNLTIDEVAERMNISERTVRFHTKNVRLKLVGEKSKKSDLIKYAMDSGIAFQIYSLFRPAR